MINESTSQQEGPITICHNLPPVQNEYNKKFYCPGCGKTLHNALLDLFIPATVDADKVSDNPYNPYPYYSSGPLMPDPIPLPPQEILKYL